MTTYKSENKLESGQIVDPAINTCRITWEWLLNMFMKLLE